MKKMLYIHIHIPLGYTSKYIMPKYYIPVALEDEYDKKARLRGYVQLTKVLLLLCDVEINNKGCTSLYLEYCVEILRNEGRMYRLD